MSQENVEIVRRGWEAFNQGHVDAWLAALAEDVEFEEDPTFPEARVFRGRDEIAGYISAFQEQMADHRFEIEEIRDLGDRVLTLLHETARGVSSGILVDQRPAFLFHFHDGWIVRMRAYLDRAEALKAVGLEG